MRLAILPALLTITLLAAPILADDAPKAKSGPPRAPAGYVIFDSDDSGADFIARPLMDQYDALIKTLADLRTKIDEAKIDGASARREVDKLQAELREMRARIDRAKVRITGASVHTVTETESFPIADGERIFLEASNVDIRGWDRPEVRLDVIKTVFADGDDGVAADFDGIKAIHHRSNPERTFGFYTSPNVQEKFKAEWGRFPFKDFLEGEFFYLTLRGLTHEEGNRQISLKMLNEEGAGLHSSQWRRHAKLVVYVPKCKKVGVRGALGGFKVHDLEAPLTVEGAGDRDYAASYEIANLGGSLTAVDIAIHRIDGVRGDATVVATAYSENSGTRNDDLGTTSYSPAPRPSAYREVSGDLQARFTRADLSLERIGGRVDVQNAFGRTSWRIDRPLAAKDHRLVSEGGAIDLRLDRASLGDLGLALFTECGTVHLVPGEKNGLEEHSFRSSTPDGIARSWRGFTRKAGEDREGIALFDRVADSLFGRPRTPGVDVLSRAGTITVSSPRPAPAR